MSTECGDNTWYGCDLQYILQAVTLAKLQYG